LVGSAARWAKSSGGRVPTKGLAAMASYNHLPDGRVSAAAAPDDRVRLRPRAHELDSVGHHAVLEATLESRAVGGHVKLVNQRADRVDELCVLYLHALQLFARPVLRPLPLRRLLD
jgi:hypothetical protein